MLQTQHLFIHFVFKLFFDKRLIWKVFFVKFVVVVFLCLSSFSSSVVSVLESYNSILSRRHYCHIDTWVILASTDITVAMAVSRCRRCCRCHCGLFLLLESLIIIYSIIYALNYSQSSSFYRSCFFCLFVFTMDMASINVSTMYRLKCIHFAHLGQFVCFYIRLFFFAAFIFAKNLKFISMARRLCLLCACACVCVWMVVKLDPKSCNLEHCHFPASYQNPIA